MWKGVNLIMSGFDNLKLSLCDNEAMVGLVCRWQGEEL